MPELLMWGLILIVAGLFVAWLGAFIKSRSRRRVAEEKEPSLLELLAEAVKNILKSAAKIVSGPTIGDRIEGLGSLMVYTGTGMIIVFFIQQVGTGTAATTTTMADTTTTTGSAN